MSKFDRRNFIKKTSLTAAFASSYVYSSENLRKNAKVMIAPSCALTAVYPNEPTG